MSVCQKLDESKSNGFSFLLIIPLMTSFCYDPVKTRGGRILEFLLEALTAPVYTRIYWTGSKRRSYRSALESNDN